MYFLRLFFKNAVCHHYHWKCTCPFQRYLAWKPQPDVGSSPWDIFLAPSVAFSTPAATPLDVRPLIPIGRTLVPVDRSLDPLLTLQDICVIHSNILLSPVPTAGPTVVQVAVTGLTLVPVGRALIKKYWNRIKNKEKSIKIVKRCPQPRRHQRTYVLRRLYYVKYAFPTRFNLIPNPALLPDLCILQHPYF